jgi:hypothetical protein
MQFAAVLLLTAFVTATVRSNPEMIRVLIGKKDAKVTYREEGTWILALTGAIIFMWYKEWPKMINFLVDHPQSLVLLGAIILFFYSIGVERTLKFFLRGLLMGSLVSLFGAMKSTCQTDASLCPSKRIAGFFEPKFRPAAIAPKPKEVLAPDSIFLISDTWSTYITTGTDNRITWTSLGNYAFEIMDQEGNTMVYPKVIKNGAFLDFRNANGSLARSIRAENGGAIWPTRLIKFRVRAIDTTGVRFKIDRKPM